MNHPGRVLILRTGNVGDTACALPALAAVRYNFPLAHLTLLTSPGPRGLPEAREVLERQGLVDEIITFYREDFADLSFRKNLLRNLRQRRFDLFLLFPQERTDLRRTFRDLLFARLLGVKGAWGFTLAHHFPFMDNRRLHDYRPPHNEVERLLLLLQRTGINSLKRYQIQLPMPCQQMADRLLEPYFQNGSRPVIGLQTRAKAQANQWPLANFTELGRRLQATCQPVFILFGGPAEKDQLQEFAHTFPGDKFIAAGQTSLLETTALLSRCHVQVTLDTGPMHLAALVGTPIVALFSARQFPVMWEPCSDNAVILRKSVPCELCFQEDCDHLTCMKAITVEEVYAAVLDHLRRHNRQLLCNNRMSSIEPASQYISQFFLA
ncbi:glycosyltransferase family 9 protein [Desulfobacca acetoxidans]|nr:glycosyltransferase family 9 protein [Desulfobacca acetoxidans]